MQVLVVAASRHGATREIADAVVQHFRSRQIDATGAEPSAISSLEGYDAVVVGSAVYMGGWLSDASDFVKRFSDELTSRRVWLFSSGPLDDQETPTLSDDKLDALIAATGATGHHVFAGRLDRSTLGVVERVVARVVHAPEGDFRDWSDVAAWADTIADTLTDHDGAS